MVRASACIFFDSHRCRARDVAMLKVEKWRLQKCFSTCAIVHNYDGTQRQVMILDSKCLG